MSRTIRFRGVRAALDAGRLSAGITWRRTANRVFDVAGWAAGYCMATTWQQERATYAPGYRHWRCWVKRSAHAGPHRTGAYRWTSGGRPIYDPLGINLLRRDPDPGTAPRWARGRHKDVGTRRRDRLEVRTARAVVRKADALRSLGRAGLGSGGAVTVEQWRAALAEDAGTLWAGELGVMPFTARPADDNDEQGEQ